MVEEEIIKARLRKKKEIMPNIKIMKMGVNASLSYEEMIEEIEKGTGLGKVFAEAEQKMLNNVREKEKEALKSG